MPRTFNKLHGLRQSSLSLVSFNPCFTMASSAPTPTGDANPVVQPPATSSFQGKPYLQCLESLHHSFPALKSFLEKLANEDEPGRKAVQDHYTDRNKSGPGRCYVLDFTDTKVSVIGDGACEDPAALRSYLEEHPAKQSRADGNRRLFILEDMEPDFVDALGHHLGVDPLVFSEQMNTWNFTDSWSIPHRGLPSMSVPEQSFTLRYYELRTLYDAKSVDVLGIQMSFASNRRRYERWRDIDVPSVGKPDRRHAFVRRCASFWTSQEVKQEGDESVQSNPGDGWDGKSSHLVITFSSNNPQAVILVDPAFSVVPSAPQIPIPSPNPTSTLGKPTPATAVFTPDNIELDAAAIASLDTCYILRAPGPFPTRASLWEAQGWTSSPSPLTLSPLPHASWPYHNGCSTIAPLMFSQLGIGAKESNYPLFRTKRNLSSPMDEMVFYWTHLASKDLLRQTGTTSANSAYFLVKHVAQHWVNHLELMNTTIAKAEWFADDYQASIDSRLSKSQWKSDLVKINSIAKDINYMRRHFNHFWRAMYANLERLGVQLGNEGVDETLGPAIKGAQKDFLTIHTRMAPLRDRAEALNSVANDLANLRAAFRGVHDGEFSLRLSLFASIVFPLTLVASIFSMGDDYLPGEEEFWKLWAIGMPICVGVALGLVYGKRPWQVWRDGKEVWRGWEERGKKRVERKGRERVERKREGSNRVDEEGGYFGK